MNVPSPLSPPAARRADRRRPVDLVYRYVPGVDAPSPPSTASEARRRLALGNENLGRFVGACKAGPAADGRGPEPILLDPHEVGLGQDAGGYPAQEPFALVLGCADARTPAEITFGQSFNDIFNIRVAGNVLGVECAGSVRYALGHFAPCSTPAAGNPQSLRLLLALGHLNCGAVKAAVDAFQLDLPPGLLPDSSVGAILQRISFPSLMTAAAALDARRGPGASADRRHASDLADLVVELNAAWAARELRQLVPNDPVSQRHVEVAYGVFDPRDCSVGAGPTAEGSCRDAFAEPPRDLKDLRDLATRLVNG